MHWVYLSPHFDDVVLSCGGMVWDAIQAGDRVEIWTICAGAPDPDAPLSPFAQRLHERWGAAAEAVSLRLNEDAAAVRRLGAVSRYWDLPDCIYRRLPDDTWLVGGEDDLWQPVHPLEQPLVERLAGWLAGGLSAEVTLVSPLTIGNHVDHRLTRAAAELASAQVGSPLLYYPDYPYVARRMEDWSDKIGPGWQQRCGSVSPEGLLAWQDGVACYTSQLSTFFKDRADLDASLDRYLQTGGGACLWQPA